MKKCNMCGSQLQDNYQACPNCGNSNLIQMQPNYQYQPVNNPVYTNNVQRNDGNIGWGFLGFFVPVIGLVLFCVWKDEQPLNAKYAGMGALISTILSVVFVVLYFVFIFVMIAATAGY